MSELMPLLSDHADEFETLLLRSADDDEPAARSLERVSAALGVSASALAVASAGGALGGHAAVAVNATALAKELSLWSLGKWLAIGVTAGFASGGAAHWVSHATSRAKAEPIAEASRAAPARTSERTSAAAPVALPPATENQPDPANQGGVAGPALATGGALLPSPVRAPALERTPALGPSSASFEPLEETRAPSAPSVAAASASTLGDETKALDRVRSHLAAGRPAQALAELERYRATWPRGALAAEATLLRVDALLRSGHRAAAQHEADTLISAAPQSRYASRARALMHE